MSNVNIEMMRIDERLIHGQGQMWLNALGVNITLGLPTFPLFCFTQ